MTDDAALARFEFLPATGQRPATVRVSGDIDLSNSGEFETVLSQAMAISGDTTVDMTKVTYCDSAAIRALLITAKQTRLTVEVTRDGAVTTLLTVSGLDQIARVVTRDG